MKNYDLLAQSFRDAMRFSPDLFAAWTALPKTEASVRSFISEALGETVDSFDMAALGLAMERVIDAEMSALYGDDAVRPRSVGFFLTLNIAPEAVAR